MCDKAVNTCFYVFTSVPDQYKTQKMCNRVIFEDTFMLIYSPNRYETQKMSNEAVTSKMLEKVYDAFLANNDILFYY